MSSLFKITIVQYWLRDCWLDAQGNPCPEGTPGARFVKRRRVKPGTPGAKKVKRKSTKWYTRVPGSPNPVPLSANKTAAQIMLGELTTKAELGKVGVGDPFKEHRKRPLVEHIEQWCGPARWRSNKKACPADRRLRAPDHRRLPIRLHQ